MYTKGMNEAPEKPECLAIMICDQVYRDERTKKLVLAGVFSNLHAREFPYRHPSMTVLFTLSGGRGEYSMSLILENADTGEEVHSLSGPLRLDEPEKVVDFTVQMMGVRFPKSGKHEVVIKIDGEIIKQRPFMVTKVEVKS